MVKGTQHQGFHGNTVILYRYSISSPPGKLTNLPALIMLVNLDCIDHGRLYFIGIKIITCGAGLTMQQAADAMGTSLSPREFKNVARAPHGVALVIVMQLLITPLLALGVAKLFNVSPAIAVGMLLVAALSLSIYSKQTMAIR